MFLALFPLSTTTWKTETKDGTEAVDGDDDDDDDDEDEETHGGPEEAGGPARPPPVVVQAPSGGTVRGDGDVHKVYRNIIIITRRFLPQPHLTGPWSWGQLYTSRGRSVCSPHW